MLITNNFSNIAATQPTKDGNSLPPEKAAAPSATEKTTSLRDLAKTTDPANMSRNEARAIAVALGQTGDLELANAFALQSMILVNDGGTLRPANENDAIMNEKFNMFDALKSNIEFNKSKGFSTEDSEKGLKFLEKLQQLKQSSAIDSYA